MTSQQWKKNAILKCKNIYRIDENLTDTRIKNIWNINRITERSILKLFSIYYQDYRIKCFCYRGMDAYTSFVGVSAGNVRHYHIIKTQENIIGIKENNQRICHNIVYHNYDNDVGEGFVSHNDVFNEIKHIFNKNLKNGTTKTENYNHRTFLKIIKERVNEIENKKEYNINFNSIYIR